MLGIYRRVIPIYPTLCRRFSRKPLLYISEVLEAKYSKERYPTRAQFEEMSRELGESYDRLYGWFSYRRYAEKNGPSIRKSEQMVTHQPRFSAATRRALDARYDENCYPTRDELEQMSQELGARFKSLSCWFRNRRCAERRVIKAMGIKSHPLLETLRPRVSTTVAEALEAIYVRNRYPTYEELEKMSQELGESHDRLYNWFLYQRIKEKKVISSTGMEEKLGEFRASRRHTDLKPYRARLEAAFQQDMFPTVEQRKLLAAELMVPYDSIVGWFTHRRVKERVLRQKAGLDTSEFKRTGLKTRKKMQYLQDYVTRTGNLDPSKSEVLELASKTGERFGAVRRWFFRRQTPQYRESRRRVSRARDALLQELFNQNQRPATSAIEEIAREVGKSSVWVRQWFGNRRYREKALSSEKDP